MSKIKNENGIWSLGRGISKTKGLGNGIGTTILQDPLIAGFGFIIRSVFFCILCLTKRLDLYFLTFYTILKEYSIYVAHYRKCFYLAKSTGYEFICFLSPPFKLSRSLIYISPFSFNDLQYTVFFSIRIYLLFHINSLQILSSSLSEDTVAVANSRFLISLCKNLEYHYGVYSDFSISL